MVALAGMMATLVHANASAGQPFEKVGAQLIHAPGTVQGPSASHTATIQPEFHRALDLTVPAQSATQLDSFTNPGRHTFEPAAHVIVPASASASAFSGTDGRQVLSPIQSMAHNFRQQGLPVARLFENKDSLVHLGLNQKGKPGLWIMHKLH